MRITRLMVLLALLPACKQEALDLSGLKCEAGKCIDGYSCDTADEICVTTGDPCTAEGRTSVCGPTSIRTCTNGRWGSCDACTLGELTSCASCNNDCTLSVLNATPLCEPSGPGFVCNYSACSGAFFDADGNRANGCECVRTNGGVEICDAIDNDCNGAVDNAVSNCQCATAAPTAETCDGVDNDCNNGIDETFPCTGGGIRDCDAGTGPTSGSEACDAGTCAWSGVCTPKDLAPPGVVSNFVGTPGDTTASLTWIYPNDSDLAQCVVMRTTGSAPANHTDGAQVGNFLAPTPGGAGSFNDSGLTNSTTYFYAVFCRDASGNWRDTVNAGNSGSVTPVGVPPALVTDFVASDGANAQSVLTFTMPVTPVDECVVRRKTGSYSADHTDGVQVGGSFTGAGTAKNFTDTVLIDGTTYFYAVFCRNGTTWNDTVDSSPPGNADTGLPVGAPANPIDFAASDGENGQSVITFTMPVAPVDECVVMRKTGSYPTNHTDGTAVGGSFSGAGTSKNFTDTALANGTTYFYAVFCRNGAQWNESVDSSAPGVSADTALPSAVASVVTITGRVLTCAPLVPAATRQSLQWIDVSATGQANTLTAITFASHPNSTVVADTELPNAQLWNDLNNDGIPAGGDTQVGTTQAFSAGSVTFSGLSLSLPLATPVRLILTADVAAGATVNSYYAARISSNASFTVSVAGTTALGATPLDAQAHAVTNLSCFGGLPNFVPGSASVHAVASIVQPGAAGWQTAADNTANCTAETCYPFGTQINSLMDCSLDDNGDPERLRVSDDGNTGSRIAHINTGVPLGMPICGLTMRVYASDSRQNSTTLCSTNNTNNRLFGDAYGTTPQGTCGPTCLGLDTHYLFWYATGDNTSGTVNATGTGALTPTINTGPTSANLCFTQWVDHNVKALYDAAVAGGAAPSTGTFHVRFVADTGDGLGTDAALTIQHLPEIYIDIR